jgi:PHD/YefM family antitoxin component YafN of YafNO toxin-antitoxin module
MASLLFARGSFRYVYVNIGRARLNISMDAIDEEDDDVAVSRSTHIRCQL